MTRQVASYVHKRTDDDKRGSISVWLDVSLSLFIEKRGND
jgi:hypothetical protein